MTLKLVSIFSGGGGIDTGFHAAGLLMIIGKMLVIVSKKTTPRQKLYALVSQM